MTMYPVPEQQFPLLFPINEDQRTPLTIPVALDGSIGQLRQPDTELNMIQVDTDIEAVSIWLNTFKSSATRRAYAKEAERLLLWCYSVAGKPLSSLYLIDYQEYRRFILDPPADWCGPRRARNSGDWKPFTGPLSTKSADQAFTIIKALLAYLTATGYLVSSPLAARVTWEDERIEGDEDKREAIADRLKKNSSKEHFLTYEDVDLILETAKEIADPDPSRPFDQKAKDDCERKQFLVALLLGTGLRIEEVAMHSMNSFRTEENRKGEKVHRFRFVGKGSKDRWVPVSPRLLSALHRYRQHLGLSPFPSTKETTPLIPNLRTGKAVTSRTLNRLLTDVLNRSAEKVSEEHPEQAEKLLAATPHWFRHTAVTEIGRHADIRLQQTYAGHADIRTTMIYNHSDEDALQDAVEKGRY